MNAAKTSTQRSDELRQRRTEQGLQEVRGAWAHPDDHAAVKNCAAKLTSKRNAKTARRHKPETFGLPPYPDGEVVCACVCGSWPGGKCLRCPVVLVGDA